MKRLFFPLFLMACLTASASVDPGARAPMGAESPQAAAVQHRERPIREVPPQAFEVLRQVTATGRAPQGYVGGRRWENRERRLPQGGAYREYDIHPKVRGRNRGPERIVYDVRTGRAWYTPDHYRTFIPFTLQAVDR